ncbi:hypothetical protein K474DRAFT_1609025 [Panus rudis PR-1116 ss-1]|nr:hypothetical protein K474DRAFT_1609025 [Panus rudis PR-1116 ss-1]
MQTTSYYPLPMMMGKQTNSGGIFPGDASALSAHASVSHLLSRAYALPCSTAAQAFTQLVQPISRFQMALEVLFPLLDSPAEIQKRILVAYILYFLYAPHPISMNPFRSALLATFIKEKDHAMQVAEEGGISENEQLVWVLWKILRGDGNDIGPFSPGNLAKSPVPPQLRAAKLTLDEKAVLDSLPANGMNDTPEYPDRASAVTPPPRDADTISFSQGMNLLLAARDRVLSLSEQRLISPPAVTAIDLAPIIANNPAIAQPLLVALLSQPPVSGVEPYLDVLRRLPPVLTSFDLIGYLLRDATAIQDPSTGGTTTIADLVRSEVLGWFIHEAIAWLDKAEEDEKAGLISDDRFAKGLANLCRFFNSLIKLNIIDPSSDADSTEMAHFTLRNSRFEEANSLYRVLAMGKF